MKQLAQYQKNGYVILRGFFNNADVLDLEHHADQSYRKWLNENELEIYSQMLVNMDSLTSPEYFKDLPKVRVAFFEAIASTKLVELLEAMFGSGIYFHNTQLFFNPSNNARLPYWHRDMQYSTISDEVQRAELHNMLSLHVRIPFVEETGVEVVNGSHARWDTDLEHNVRLELNGHSNSEALPNTTLIDLLPGDVLIFHAQMIHRGNYALNPTRKALDLCVGKYHPMTFSFFDAQVLPTKEEMNAIANNQWYSLASDLISKKQTRSASCRRQLIRKLCAKVD